MLAFFALLLLVPLTLAALWPLGFPLTSLSTLHALPGQLVRLLFDRRRRRNHALEHATTNVLEEQYGASLALSGFAAEDGFWLQGPAHPQAVLAAAREGLERLQAGERKLALHPRCTTVLASGVAISTLAFALLLLALGSGAALNVLLALVVAIVLARGLARPVGLLLQRGLITSADVRGLTVDRMDAQMPQSPFALILAGGQPTAFRIWTHDVQIQAASGPKRWRAY